jgi:hypothetical protein
MTRELPEPICVFVTLVNNTGVTVLSTMTVDTAY